LQPTNIDNAGKRGAPEQQRISHDISIGDRERGGGISAGKQIACVRMTFLRRPCNTCFLP